MGNKICCEETMRREGQFDIVDPKMIEKPIIDLKHPQPQLKEQTYKPLQYQLHSEIKPQPIIQPVEEIKSPGQKLKQSSKIEQPIEVIPIPELTHQVAGKLQDKKFFVEEQKRLSGAATKRYGGDVYVGTLDENTHKPHVFGRMYKEDSSHYIGHFNHGRAEGIGAYIFADGSYYYGEFHNNQTKCTNGQYWSENLHYRGGFSNNVFEGEGIEQSRSHTFKGHFHKGSRTKGVLEWHTNKNSYSYNGEFNSHNQFHGKGFLRQPEGIYEGSFQNGQKHGQGEYKFANGATYKGGYVNGIRHGKGTIYQKDGRVGYIGEFNEGLPHGKGSVPNRRGQLVETEWVNGIDKTMLSH